MQARSAERHQRPVMAHRRAGLSHLAAGRRFTQRWTRRPRRGESAGSGDLGHNKPPRPHSLQLYTRDCTGRDPVTARGVEQATCRVIVVHHVLGCKYDVAGRQCRDGTTMALEETPGRSAPIQIGRVCALPVRGSCQAPWRLTSGGVLRVHAGASWRLMLASCSRPLGSCLKAGMRRGARSGGHARTSARGMSAARLWRAG